MAYYQYSGMLKVEDSTLIVNEGVTSITRELFNVWEESEQDDNAKPRDIRDSVKKIILPSSAQKIGDDAFRYFNNLEEVVIPEGVTSIGARAFQDRSIASINLPKSLKSIGMDAFSDCHYLEEIRIPDSVRVLENDLFNRCSRLKHVELPPTLERINFFAFRECYSLERIDIPDSVVFIGDEAFAYCERLRDVRLSDKLDTIHSGAFAHCKQLKTMNVPKSLTCIEDYAFYRCKEFSKLKVGKHVSVDDKAYGDGFFAEHSTLFFLFLFYVVLPVTILCILHHFFSWLTSILIFALGIVAIIAVLFILVSIFYKGHGA